LSVFLRSIFGLSGIKQRQALLIRQFSDPVELVVPYVSEFFFAPPIEDNKPPQGLLRWPSFIVSAEAYWRQERYNFIKENIGVIAQPVPTNQVHMSQFHQFRFPPPVLVIQPPPPALPRWRPRAIDDRLQAFRFFQSNIIHLAEPDPSTGRSAKRRILNQPLFPPLAHPYCRPTDPPQAVIKEEDPS
jgi:hypothetical protein